MAEPDHVSEIPTETLSEIRGALAAMVREGVDLSVSRLQERSRAKRQFAGWVLAAYRAGKFPLEVPRPAPAPAPVLFVGPRATDAPPLSVPTGAPTAEQLAALVAGVDSHEKALDATREVMRAAALGAAFLDPKLATLLLDGLREARQSIKGKALEGGEQIEDFMPATAEAVELVGVFEGITDDARRAGVLSFARRELETDVLVGPRALGQVTTGGTA
jgi:hypothetical protein